MLFSSIPFLYYFLPAVVLLYLLAPRRLKNGVLLLASLLFYGWGEPRYVPVMLGAILSAYLFGLLMERYRGGPMGKAALWLSVAVSVGVLFWFKYAGFFAESFATVTGLPVAVPKIVLPIGISFYTFQLLSYTVDVYRGDVKAQRNIVTLATYVALFPQLIAGPIVRYTQVAEQLASREHSAEKTAQGIRRFVLGLGKKVLIANALGELCSKFRASGDLSVLFYWLYALAFTFQIYFDFSGYSDMAIGLGKLFGFRFPENFNYPYLARSMTEFWRRWHISLGNWFRDYVYIPMGGNRVSRGKWLRNILVVWLLTGLWHGAAWNFALWGLYFGLLLLAEKLWLRPFLERRRVLSHVYAMFFVTVGFVIFNAGSLGQVASDLKCLFGLGGLPLSSEEFLYCLRSYGVTLLAALVGATPLPARAAAALERRSWGGKLLTAAEPAALAALTLIVTAYLVNGSFNPFLYFRF